MDPHVGRTGTTKGPNVAQGPRNDHKGRPLRQPLSLQTVPFSSSSSLNKVSITVGSRKKWKSADAAKDATGWCENGQNFQNPHILSFNILIYTLISNMSICELCCWLLLFCWVAFNKSYFLPHFFIFLKNTKIIRKKIRYLKHGDSVSERMCAMLLGYYLSCLGPNDINGAHRLVMVKLEHPRIIKKTIWQFQTETHSSGGVQHAAAVTKVWTRNTC